VYHTVLLPLNITCGEVVIKLWESNEMFMCVLVFDYFLYLSVCVSQIFLLIGYLICLQIICLDLLLIFPKTYDDFLERFWFASPFSIKNDLNISSDWFGSSHQKENREMRENLSIIYIFIISFIIHNWREFSWGNRLISWYLILRIHAELTDSKKCWFISVFSRSNVY